MHGENMVNYWLMKSELDVYPWSQLVEDKSTHWDGVRNYQARNIMRDDMKIGDWVLFYHSNCKPPHVAGVAKVCREGYPDFTAQDPNSKYFDEKASPENPRWIMVDIEPIIEMEAVGLPDLKANQVSRECVCYSVDNACPYNLCQGNILLLFVKWAESTLILCD